MEAHRTPRRNRSLTVIQFMYEYSDLFCNNHLSMLPDYMFSCDTIPNLIASVTQRNLYLIDATLWIMYVVCRFPAASIAVSSFLTGLGAFSEGPYYGCRYKGPATAPGSVTYLDLPSWKACSPATVQAD